MRERENQFDRRMQVYSALKKFFKCLSPIEKSKHLTPTHHKQKPTSRLHFIFHRLTVVLVKFFKKKKKRKKGLNQKSRTFCIILNMMMMS